MAQSINTTGYGSPTSHNTGYVQYNLATLAPSPSPIMKITWSKQDNIVVEINGVESGVSVNMLFQPEQNITPNELMLISMLFLAGSCCVVPSREAAIAYIRKHSLERHFKFN